MNDGLKDRHRRAILDILRAHPGVERAVLFGSRAMGTFAPASDVDICLYGDSLTLTDQARLAARMEELTIPQRVDLLLHHAIEDQALLDHIAREGKVLFERDRGGGEWKERLLGELTENLDSVRVPVRKADRGVGPYPYYGASGIVDYVDKYLFDGEYLLVAEDGENLRTRTTPVAFLARGRFWVNNHAHIVRGNSQSDTRFLMYALSETDISGYLTGSTMPKLTQSNMNRVPLRTPPLPVQRAIAHILGTLDDKIDLNRRMNETLEAMARALFKSWFVDFDPVRAKAEGRDPGLPKPLADLFPARLVDSELGEIPEGWEVGCFGDVVKQLRDNQNPFASPDVSFRHCSIPAFDEGQWPKQEFGETIKSQKSRVPPGVVLLSKLNPEIERVWLVDVKPEDRAVCSAEFLVLRPSPPHGRSYVYCLARAPVFRRAIEGLVTGTSKSHQRAQVGSILALPIVRPPDALLHQFERAAGPQLKRTLECRRESRTLAALRDTLLPKLISGELRVKNAEKFIEEAGA